MEKQDMSQVARTVRSLMREKKYKEVIKTARGLNLNRINNGLLILDIVEAYEKIGDKKAAKMALLNYYDVHGITGRNMMQKLIELCIETRDISNAVGLCMEFENEWPESSISYLMRYQITTSAGGSLDERIYYLEKYRETEFEERWGYELAKLYDKNNQKEKCAEICHEIICFFGTGKYVEKAVQLKERVAGLTEDEINIVETAKRREEEARERREEEERIAREEMARLAEEEARRAQEQEERRRQEEAYRRQEEEYRRQEEENRYRLIAEEQEKLGEREVEYGYRTEASQETAEETEEAYAARKKRQAEDDKIRQTEEAARLLREKKEADRIAREQKIAEALKVSDRYAQVEKYKGEDIYFDEIIRAQESAGGKTKQKNSSENKGFLSSFGKMASNVKKTLQPDEDYLEEDDAGAEIEYITVGRDTQAYADDVEERMLSELDMLDDSQIDNLTAAQIKEIYELKVLHDVRESIRALIVDANDTYHTEISQEELDQFVDRDPYVNPLETEEPSASGAEEKEIKAAEPEIEPEIKPEAEPEIKSNEKKSMDKPEVESEEIEETIEKVLEDRETEESAEAVSENQESEKTEELENPEIKIKSEELTTGEKENTEEISEEEPEEISEEEPGEILEEEPEKKSESVEPVDGPVSNPEVKQEEKTETGTETQEEANQPETNEQVKETILDRIEDPDTNLSVEEFSECITAYAELKGYQIEETAYMTIAVLAESIQQKSIPLSLNNAKKMADNAIARIQKRNPLDKIVDRYSKKHAYLLKDKHFDWKF